MDNTVELIGTYGNDELIACSAWTSTNRAITPEKKSRIDKLLLMLAENGHETPFEKSAIHFLVSSDIASHIHKLKHRIGVSINAESARYKRLREDKFYVPVDWNEEEKKIYNDFCELVFKNYHEMFERLTKRGVEPKRAKESSRYFLNYGKMLDCDILFNFRSFYHFLHLRYSVHAQLEIREIAKKMLILVNECGQFPLTLRAFGLVDESGNICEPFE